jgi:hypothetical protein
MVAPGRSDYEVVRVEEDRVFIVDLDLGGKSVTNDAEEVFKEIKFHFPGKRLIYRDSLSNWDEIIEDTHWINYIRYFEHVPSEEEFNKFPSSNFLR